MLSSIFLLLVAGFAAIALAFLMGRWESRDSMAGAVAACAIFVLIVFAVIGALKTARLHAPTPALAYATTLVYYLLLVGLSARAYEVGGER